jgi:hypothetical protein
VKTYYTCLYCSCGSQFKTTIIHVYNQGEILLVEVGGEPGLRGGGNSGGRGNGKIDFGGGGGGGGRVIPGITIGGKGKKGGGLDGGG